MRKFDRNLKRNNEEIIIDLPISHREPIKPSKQLHFSDSGSQKPPFSQTISLQFVVTEDSI